jgi:HEAT repeat protein
MPVAEAGALSSLVKILSSTESNVLQRACEAIKNMCWNLDAVRKKAFDAGAIPVLVGLLSNNNVRVQESAMFALWKVSLHDSAARAAHAANATPLIIGFLESSDKSLQRSAVGALYAITNGSQCQDIKLAVFHGGALPILIKILNSDQNDMFGITAAALRNLVHVASAVTPAISAGAIPALVKHLVSGDVNVQSRACEALKNVCGCSAGAHAATSSANAIPSLVFLLASPNMELQKTAVITLEKLSVYAPTKDALEQAVPVMKRLRSSGTDELKKLATAFLKRVK